MGKKINFEKCSELNIFLGVGSVLKSDITFEFDGDSILLVSLVNGQNVGYININKEDKQKLKKFLK